MGKIIFSPPKIILETDSTPLTEKENRSKYSGAAAARLIGYTDIQNRVSEMSRDITKYYIGESVTILALLEGAKLFTQDLQTDLYNPLDSNHSFFKQEVKVRSYEGTKSTGTIEVVGGLPGPIGGNYLLVDDICDTGETLRELERMLLDSGASDVKSAALLHKRTDKSNLYVPDFVGFSIPNDFVIGFGMDYNGHFRKILDIVEIHPDAVEQYKKAS